MFLLGRFLRCDVGLRRGSHHPESPGHPVGIILILQRSSQEEPGSKSGFGKKKKKKKVFGFPQKNLLLGKHQPYFRIKLFLTLNIRTVLFHRLLDSI